MIASKPENGPRPVWPDAPRLCPERRFPSYRYVPGELPHPVNDPAGHSFGGTPPLSIEPPWETCEAFRYGIDLYHFGYLWESHEAWEPLWRALGRESVEGRFVQALIRNSAALLKAHVGNQRGAERHSRAAYGLLAAVYEERGVGCRVLEMDVMDLMDAMDRCYGGSWTGSNALGPPLRLVRR